MLPKEILRRFKNPGELERNFINYLKKSKASINQDKTIAYQVLNDAKELTIASTQQSFFNGSVLNPAATNIQNSYIRPESEHFLIYGIRCYFFQDESSLPLPDVPWTKNINSLAPAIDNAIFSVVCNSVQYLKNVPLTVFIDTETATNNDRSTLLLDEPILWQGQTEFQLQVQTKDLNGFEAGSYLRFDLVGIGLI